MKKIYSHQTINELVNLYPELKDVLYDIGFKLISNPVMLNTMGKIMTIKKGCEMRGIKLDQIIIELKKKGYHYVEEKNE